MALVKIESCKAKMNFFDMVIAMVLRSGDSDREESGLRSVRYRILILPITLNRSRSSSQSVSEAW